MKKNQRVLSIKPANETKERIGTQYVLPFYNSVAMLRLLTEPRLFEESQNPRGVIVSTALSLLGYPVIKYRGPAYGLTPKLGFDCSGFILFVLKQTQHLVPQLDMPDDMRHANEMFDRLGVFVHQDRIRSGDLVFYSRTGHAVTHAGIYVGSATNGKDYMIHSPGVDGEKVKITTIRGRELYNDHVSELCSLNSTFKCNT